MARILVVEDDPAQRFLYAQLIRRIGFDAVGVEDAVAAFELLESGVAINLILTDMSLPGLHGPAFVHAIRERWPHMPVAMMSVRASKDWNLDPHTSGILYLQKPFDRYLLGDTLRAALGLNKQSQVP